MSIPKEEQTFWNLRICPSESEDACSFIQIVDVSRETQGNLVNGFILNGFTVNGLNG
jgi:hypothetical protein